MIFAILFVIVVGLFFIITNPTNKICRAISLCILGVCVLMFTGILYTCKFSYYDSTFQFDYRMYLALSNIKLSMTALSWISTAGTTLILVSYIFFIFFLSPDKKWRFFVLLIPIIIFVATSSPPFCYNAYIMTYSANTVEKSKSLQALFELIRNINITIFLVYMCIPVFSLAIYAKRTKIFFLKHDALISLICMAFIDVFLLYMFIFGMFRDIMFHNPELLRFPNGMHFNSHSFYTPALWLFFISILLFFITFYKPFHSLVVISEKQLLRNDKQLSKNLRMILHAEKNTIFTINLLAKQGIENKNRVDEKLMAIEEISKQSMENLSRTLDLFRDTKMEFEKSDLIKCISNALYKVFTPNINIAVKTYFNNYDKLYINMDKQHIHEVFVNLFQNSLDAMKSVKNAEISVSVTPAEGFAIIDITDNGCGIEKKNIRKIFSPLFSTKSNSNNWGVGLHYVNKVLKLHNGYIRALSKPGETTTFQIIIPLAV